MKEADLIALVSKIRMLKSEGQTWEIKSAANGCPQKLFDTLSSFSNQDDGGVIVFGISESDDYAIIGVADAEMLSDKDVRPHDIPHCNPRKIKIIRTSFLCQPVIVPVFR